MIHRIVLLLLCCCCLNGEEIDFTAAMGKGTPDWRYVATPEDQMRIGMFQALYDKNRTPAHSGRIPQTLHFIWLGPKPFPQHSVVRVQQWIAKHPGWKVKFWTDQDRPVPDVRMEKMGVEKFPLYALANCYQNADNFGERSMVLRYAILLREGGVYVDHDLRCLKPIEQWQSGFDFFCGLEPLAPAMLSSSITPGAHLIGAMPGHPILVEASAWLQANWERIEGQYPGQEISAILNRVQHRSLSALDCGIALQVQDSSYRNVVLPSLFFSNRTAHAGAYALHAHEQTWLKNDVDQARKVQHGFQAVIDRLSSAFLLACVLGMANLVLGWQLVRMIRRLKKVET